MPAGLPACTHAILLYFWGGLGSPGLAETSMQYRGQGATYLLELPSSLLLKAAPGCAVLLARYQAWLWPSDRGSKGAVT